MAVLAAMPPPQSRNQLARRPACTRRSSNGLKKGGALDGPGEATRAALQLERDRRELHGRMSMPTRRRHNAASRSACRPGATQPRHLEWLTISCPSGLGALSRGGSTSLAKPGVSEHTNLAIWPGHVIFFEAGGTLLRDRQAEWHTVQCCRFITWQRASACTFTSAKPGSRAGVSFRVVFDLRMARWIMPHDLHCLVTRAAVCCAPSPSFCGQDLGLCQACRATMPLATIARYLNYCC
jgi:hypothetical protein